MVGSRGRRFSLLLTTYHLPPTKMKIVFLDRDGVINRFPGNGKYVTKVKDFHFLPGSRKAIRRLTDEGFKIFIVSNQAGVGKGIFTQEKLDKITNKMLKGVKESGGKILEVYYSTSRSDEGCQFRKPNIGSIQKAMKKLKKDLRAAKNAFFVGDTETDIQCAHNAGCKSIFVMSGRENHDFLKRKWKIRPDFIANDLLEASEIISSHFSSNGKKR